MLSPKVFIVPVRLSECPQSGVAVVLTYLDLFLFTSIPSVLEWGSSLASTLVTVPISVFLALYYNIPSVWWYFSSFPYLIMPQSKWFLCCLYYLFLTEFSTYVAGLYIFFINVTLLYFPSVSLPFNWRIGVVMSHVYVHCICAIQQVKSLRLRLRRLYWNKTCTKYCNFSELKVFLKFKWQYYNCRHSHLFKGKRVLWILLRAFNWSSDFHDAYSEKLFLTSVFSDYSASEYLTEIIFCQIWGNDLSDFHKFLYVENFCLKIFVDIR